MIMAYNNVTKYYFQKPDDFYQRDDIRKLERISDGYEMITIYEKILIETLNKEGLLAQFFGEKKEKYTIEDLSYIFHHSESMIEKSLNMFLKLNMIEENEDGILYFPDSERYTRKTTVGAERQKEYRNSKKDYKCSDNKDYICNSCEDDKCPTELELKIEKEIKPKSKKELELILKNENNIINKEKDKIIELESISKVGVIFKEIVDYLNFKTNSNYKYTTPKTQKDIKARMNEGFSIEDFKTVIDKKSKEWENTEYMKYLRPETLFSNKFESYLNQKETIKKDEVIDTLEAIYNGSIRI